jgi:ArsR family metal-binding transcriptional regulator
MHACLNSSTDVCNEMLTSEAGIREILVVVVRENISCIASHISEIANVMKNFAQLALNKTVINRPSILITRKGETISTISSTKIEKEHHSYFTTASLIAPSI